MTTREKDIHDFLDFTLNPLSYNGPPVRLPDATGGNSCGVLRNYTGLLVVSDLEKGSQAVESRVMENILYKTTAGSWTQEWDEVSRRPEREYTMYMYWHPGYGRVFLVCYAPGGGVHWDDICMGCELKVEPNTGGSQCRLVGAAMSARSVGAGDAPPVSITGTVEHSDVTNLRVVNNSIGFTYTGVNTPVATDIGSKLTCRINPPGLAMNDYHTSSYSSEIDMVVMKVMNVQPLSQVEQVIEISQVAAWEQSKYDGVIGNHTPSPVLHSYGVMSSLLASEDFLPNVFVGGAATRGGVSRSKLLRYAERPSLIPTEKVNTSDGLFINAHTNPFGNGGATVLGARITDYSSYPTCTFTHSEMYSVPVAAADHISGSLVLSATQPCLGTYYNAAGLLVFRQTVADQEGHSENQFNNIEIYTSRDSASMSLMVTEGATYRIVGQGIKVLCGTPELSSGVMRAMPNTGANPWGRGVGDLHSQTQGAPQSVVDGITARRPFAGSSDLDFRPGAAVSGTSGTAGAGNVAVVCSGLHPDAYLTVRVVTHYEFMGIPDEVNYTSFHVTPSPRSLDYARVMCALSNYENFPLTASGHSFTAWFKRNAKVIGSFLLDVGPTIATAIAAPFGVAEIVGPASAGLAAAVRTVTNRGNTQASPSADTRPLLKKKKVIVKKKRPKK